MAKDAHALQGNPKWLARTPYLGINTYFLAVPKEGEPEKVNINHSHYCREMITGHVQKVISQSLNGRGLELAYPHETAPGLCALRLAHAYGEPTLLPKEVVESWDAVVGLTCLLLDPTWPKGDWWRTAIPEGPTTEWNWKGTTNAFLFHPALASVVLGLFRQVFLLHLAGCLPQMLASIDRAEVEAALTQGDRDLAFRIVKKLRPWVQVPAPSMASLHHFPVPLYTRRSKEVSYWERFTCLIRAVGRHGLEKVFANDSASIWTSAYLNGAFSYWGGDKTTGVASGVTEHHKRLLALGAPRKK